MVIPFLGQKCPKCGSNKIKKIEESFFKKLNRFFIHALFLITILFYKGSKPLYVCQECGFSWEGR